MTLMDELNQKIPEYYPFMYLDGFTPEQILYAVHRKMIQEYEDRQKVDKIQISSEVKIK